MPEGKRVRTRPEVERFFAGLDLVDPGIRVLPRWRPDGTEPPPSGAAVPVYGGVARKR